ncbi:hypothetical protein L1049_009169 [Liquidambar formosana]|uniref:Dof zinc finger protein n=1 Tax=Liquidambar formosana TaxID=63359 RepID=A0AAP0SAK4_LIQFO
MERGWKPNVEICPHCPRCGSSNTKFCYYNNYSLTQPRYFCKGCRRYWTKGGSLRNVPVGGGCRKNRRAKSLRISSDRSPSSNSLAYAGAPNGLTGNPNGPNGNPLVGSTSSSMMSGGSNIDLAVVYANFLNQRPESKAAGDELPELPSDISVPFGTNMDSISIQESQENDFVGCPTLADPSAENHFSEANQMYLGGFDSIEKQQDRIQLFGGDDTCNYGLPPLPGEEVFSQEMAWLGSTSQMMGSNHLQSTQLPGLEPEAHDINQLVGNWSPFDLSSYETFSRP